MITVAAAALWLPAATRLAAQEPPRPPSSETPTPQVLDGDRPTPPTARQISDWIDALRHNAYAVRQDAATQLLAAGMAAREPLVAAAEGSDPEARAAARRLVALIDQAEFHHRLEAFAADTDGKHGLTLPGWKQFQELVGGDAAARALFVQMQRQEAALLADVFDDDRNSRKQSWEDRLVRLLQWPATADGRPATPPLGSCATMIFLGSVAEGSISDRGAAYLPRLAQLPPIQQAMQGATRQETVHRLVAAWVVECPNRSEIVLRQRLDLALMYRLHEAVPLALAVAQNEPTFLTAQPVTRANAVILVAEFGSRSDAEKLEPLLEDSAVCLSIGAAPPVGPMVRDVQIRDVALVAMLQLTDQNPADYGYSHARRQARRWLDVGSLHPDSDAERAAAVAKWRAWKAKQARDSRAEARDAAPDKQGS